LRPASAMTYPYSLRAYSNEGSASRQCLARGATIPSRLCRFGACHEGDDVTFSDDSEIVALIVIHATAFEAGKRTKYVHTRQGDDIGYMRLFRNVNKRVRCHSWVGLSQSKKKPPRGLFPRYRLPLDTQLSQIDGVRVSYATEERDER